MSVHVVNWVLQHSEESVAGRRLVLLVLADKADDDGTNAYPSVQTIARQARMSERGVRYALRALEDSGRIQRVGVHTRAGTYEYRVNLGEEVAAGGKREQLGGQTTTPKVSQIAPKPSMNHPEPKSPTDSVELAASASATFDDLFAYWKRQCGHKKARPTPERRKAVERRLKDGYTADEIKAGIDGAAVQPFVNDKGKAFDDLELICRTGSKLEDFIDRATYTPQGPTSQSRRSEHERLQDERKAAGLRLLDQFTDESTEAA